jgi:nucleotide-binding universal stress UspA family protein
MFETLVVPLDGSEFAAKALPAAVAIARAGHAGLRLVGIARDDDELASVQRHVNGTAREVAAVKDPEVEVIIDHDPTGALLKLAADCTSVLCFASHDRRTVAARLIHSVGSALVARAPCPILVVGDHAAQAARATDVVVAVDGVGDPQPLLATAMSWARQLGAPLRIVTVFEPAPEDLGEPGHFTRHHGPPVDPTCTSAPSSEASTVRAWRRCRPPPSRTRWASPTGWSDTSRAGLRVSSSWAAEGTRAFTPARCASSSAPCRCRWWSSTDRTDDVMTR